MSLRAALVRLLGKRERWPTADRADERALEERLQAGVCPICRGRCLNADGYCDSCDLF